MSEKDNSQQIFGRPLGRVLQNPASLKKRRIIKAHELPEDMPVRMLAGENPEDCGESPTIVLERDGDSLTKIIVRCPCGRYAEVDFTHEEEA